jgi:hypothetical protein
MPHLGLPKTITSYFHGDPSYQSNKRRAEPRSTPDSRFVRPCVSPQPPPLGDRSLSSRRVRRCQTIHQSIHPQRDRGISSRQIQSRAPPICQTTSQIQRRCQRSIKSFFLSASDARSIPRSYIATRIIQPDPLIVLEDYNNEPMPNSPSSPLAIRPRRT